MGGVRCGVIGEVKGCFFVIGFRLKVLYSLMLSVFLVVL